MNGLNKKNTFRKDINGLRAYAVLAVVLFHFNPDWLSGGFAGVDVFFVISGFLMTKIIFDGIENQKFSLINFYVARANRIIPALAFLCIALLIFGWFNLSPTRYKELAKHSLSSVGFFSNIVYFKESGYFDTSSHSKWLLHTWSLAVEWQFYIIYPIVILFLKNFLTLDSIKKSVITITFLSLLFSVYATYKWPEASYYLFPMRTWEMMLGGVAYLYPITLKAKYKKAIELIGLALILGSCFFITKNDPWPGYLAIFPVLGSFLIIQASLNNSWLTANPVFQSIGDWSYSIYLWHWPLVVYISVFSLPNVYSYVGILFSILLGYLSYRFIEKIKFSQEFPNLLSLMKCKPIYISLIIGMIGFTVYARNNTITKFRISSKLIEIDRTIVRGNYECFDKPFQHKLENSFCNPVKGHKKILAIGDSHSYSILPMLENFATEKNLSLVYTGYSGCPPIINTFANRNDQQEKSCIKLNEKIKNQVRQNKYDYIVMTSRWTYYTEGDYKGKGIQYIYTKNNKGLSKKNSIRTLKESLYKTLKIYSDKSSKIIVVLQVPMQKKYPSDIFYDAFQLNSNLNMQALQKKSISIEEHVNFQKHTNQVIQEVTNDFGNVQVVDPYKTFCSNGFCSVGNQDTSYYFDDDHLSINGSLQLKDQIHDALFNN